MPQAFVGQNTLLLFGSVYQSQFDIDRWLIGSDQTNTQVAVYEIPTIKGMFPQMFPQMFSTVFEDPIREGIASKYGKLENRKAVSTLYKNGHRVQKHPVVLKLKNTHVLLINAQAEVIYSYKQRFFDALHSLEESFKSALAFFWIG